MSEDHEKVLEDAAAPAAPGSVVVPEAVPLDRVQRYRALYFSGSSTERTVFFSDAVFAIAMTLLVLEIHAPTQGQVPPDELRHELGQIWFEYFGYALSFFFVASTWVSHHNVWRFVRGHRPGLLWLNLLMLFFVAFTPVPTAVIAAYGASTPTAPVFYALTLAAVTGSLLVVLVYAHHHQLLEERMEPGLYQMVRRQLSLPPAVFLASCVVALAWGPLFRGVSDAVADLGPLLAMLSWSTLTLVFLVSNRQMRRRLRRGDWPLT